MGIESTNKGRMAELLLEASFLKEENNGNMIWTKTYPKFTVIRTLPGGLKAGFFDSEGATPDYNLTLAGGYTVWLECKLFSKKNRYTYWQSMHQWAFLKQVCNLEGEQRTFSFYAIMWQFKGNEHWTLHPIEDIPVLYKEDYWLTTEEAQKLFFVRNDGIEIPTYTDGMPDIGRIIYRYIKQSAMVSEQKRIGSLFL